VTLEVEMLMSLMKGLTPPSGPEDLKKSHAETANSAIMATTTNLVFSAFTIISFC
jgi:hypothetical protein